MEKNTNECIGACKAVNYIQCQEYAASVSFDKFNDETYYEDYLVTSPSTPKGCYTEISNGNIVVGVYFNEDDTGASDPNFSPICARVDEYSFMADNTNECTSGSTMSYNACGSYAAVIGSGTFKGYYKEDGTYYQYARKDDPDLPKGCYRDIDEPDEIYFNDHNKGSAAAGYEPICVRISSASCGGDPHFSGFGGYFFSWQGHCDVILSSSPKAGLNKEDVMVHVRTTRRRKWSIIEAVAVSAGDDVVEIDNNGKLLLNGSKVKTVTSKSFTFSKEFLGSGKLIIIYLFNFGDGKLLEVKANTRSNMVFTNMSGDFPKGSVGLLGSPVEPGLFARNGTTNMHVDDVDEFVESWQVRDTDTQLFQNTRTPQYPNKCVYDTDEVRDYLEEVNVYLRGRRLDEQDIVTLEQAVSACAKHKFGPLRTFCEEDVMATGDLELADDAFYGS